MIKCIHYLLQFTLVETRIDGGDNNNNNNHDDIYGAVIMA